MRPAALSRLRAPAEGNPTTLPPNPAGDLFK